MDLFSKKLKCPACLGKGQMDMADIERLFAEKTHHPGKCAYCEGAGQVPEQYFEKVPLETVFPLSWFLKDERYAQLYRDGTSRSFLDRINELSGEEEEITKNVQQDSTNPVPEPTAFVNEGHYAVHKKGFFYTDEGYESVDGMAGSLLGFYATSEDASAAAAVADLKTVKSLAGTSITNFFPYSGEFDKVYSQVEEFLNTEFQIEKGNSDLINFPYEINDEQAEKILQILDLRFHFVVEYDHPKKVNLKKFRAELNKCDCEEF